MVVGVGVVEEVSWEDGQRQDRMLPVVLFHHMHI